jgi:hypothetical protein
MTVPRFSRAAHPPNSMIAGLCPDYGFADERDAESARAF